MASVNISVRKEAYNFLKNLKTDNKSFSDIILSFKKEQRGIMRFFGVLNGLDWDNKEKSMKSLRESYNKRLK